MENEGGNTKTNFKVYIFSPSFTPKINGTCVFVIDISCENVTPTLVGTLRIENANKVSPSYTRYVIEKLRIE